MTGVALASATAIVTSSPALFSPNDATVVGAPTPTKLSYAKYELTSITDITWQGILDAYWGGYGDYIGSCCTTTAVTGVDPGLNYINDTNPDTENGIYPAVGGAQPYPNDPYFPGINKADQLSDGTWQYNRRGVYRTGGTGVIYYLTDQVLDTATQLTGIPINLDNYYFEAGGVSALTYVAAGEIFGPIGGQVVATIQDLPYVIAQTFVSATSVLPTLNIGPVQVGGGILSRAYFNGYPYLGKKYYGASAIAAYVIDSIVTAFPASATAAAKTAAATPLSVSPAATSTPTTTGTVTEKSTTEKSTTEKSTTEKSTTDTSSETPKTEPSSSTEGGSLTGGGSTEGSSSTGGSSAGASSSTGGTGSSSDSSSSDSVPDPKPSTETQKAGTARAHTRSSDNPLSKIGKKISEAISGKKSSDSTSTSPGSGSTSSDSSSGRTGSSSSGS
ncbi:hypothetical protein [Candidatus Mycolicibacterium alkanivorans]|uniref:PE-PPE domain-containing protein n=1 Tax=Candidatus Mycolicibacterium alkanivorans TaxID=2954114 RepID=A0ABS9YVA2_9MYCO|nr:hypothetical protein [Candidatus Mycolicibacterium alkanivorans]MCI4674703.1 hypothetical protein [Candidatus Mycolicibacterium alkanivorans]